jgi:hypothetical protein
MSKCIVETAEGGFKSVWTPQIVICATGGKPMPEAFGVEGKYSMHISRIATPCTEDGTPITFDGKAMELPEAAIGPLAIADYMHDEEARVAFGAVMSVVHRIMKGELVAAEEPEEEA